MNSGGIKRVNSDLAGNPLPHIISLRSKIMRKEVISNPRYPHTIKIVRILEKVVPVENASEIEDEDPFATNSSSDPQTKTEKEKITLYKGKGRSFTDTTTNGMGNVDINKRKASIPVRYDNGKPVDSS